MEARDDLLGLLGAPQVSFWYTGHSAWDYPAQALLSWTAPPLSPPSGLLLVS